MEPAASSCRTILLQASPLWPDASAIENNAITLHVFYGRHRVVCIGGELARLESQRMSGR